MIGQESKGMDRSTIQCARDEVGNYQRRLERDPGSGAVTLADSPYLLVPTRVVGRELPAELRETIGPELTADVMYRLGFLTGRHQARTFYENRGIGMDRWEYRVLTGPFSAAWTGQGEAAMLVWEPSPNDDFLVMWESDNSLAAREAIASGVRSRACHLFAGYSAGWCSEASGQALQTTEVACRAEGVAHCRFIVAPPGRMQAHLSDPRLHHPSKDYDVLLTTPF
ncbi:MAG: narR2 [Conexibacter sp.]|nr:narR2 [Conexibacter sp.]